MFLIKVYSLSLYHKAAGIEIAVEPSLCGSELQDAVVGGGHSSWIILSVALTPYHVLTVLVGQHLHCALEHYGTEILLVTEID